MYVTNAMNLAKLFEENDITSLWVSVQKATDSDYFLDYTDLPPLIRTEFDKINASQLTKETVMTNKQVIVKKEENGFAYVPVGKDTQHRAFCMSPIPFPRKKPKIYQNCQDCRAEILKTSLKFQIFCLE